MHVTYIHFIAHVCSTRSWDDNPENQVRYESELTIALIGVTIL